MTFERLTYKSFMWNFGTTSFRSKEFNRKTEWQLQLLDEFWNLPGNAGMKWESNDSLQERYYNLLHDKSFTTGSEANKAKAAREKTSGLVDLGLINHNRILTDAGRELLSITKAEDYLEKTSLGISKDSLIYLSQLLKLYCEFDRDLVRPLIVIIKLLSHFDYLSFDEFRFLAPLCINFSTTNEIINHIENLRKGLTTIDKIILSILYSRENYKKGLERFCNNEFSSELLLSVSMNRKSLSYDKCYITLYNELHAVYVDNDLSRVIPLLRAITNTPVSVSAMWKNILFDTTKSNLIKRNPEEHILPLSFNDEISFKLYFYSAMHLFKTKATLKDYFDLNRRYLGLTNCFVFSDEKVSLDIVPKVFFNSAIDELYEQAYERSGLLFNLTRLQEICPALVFNDEKIIEGINQNLGTTITTIDEAFNEVERVRYERFNALVENKFSDDNLLMLLDCFENRNNDEINKLVTDNADIPTIFEYILGIIWYKVSERKGRVLSYLKLSLDANLLPVTHAAGGEADIVYEYKATEDYPEHSLLLEATLADSTNQRRMEMEPVSRHLGNHLIRTQNMNSYCIFATSYLHINVIGDFMNRKHMVYYDSQNEDKYIEGMKIIPLTTTDLRMIIVHRLTYNTLYKHFEEAYQTDEKLPKKWYDEYVNIENSNLFPHN